MNQQIIAEICGEATHGTLVYNPHYRTQSMRRPTPTRPDIAYVLCDDAPEIIEEEPERNSILIWGALADGRIAHILCRYYPAYQVITGYFPGETEPYKWADREYRVRRSVLER